MGEEEHMNDKEMKKKVHTILAADDDLDILEQTRVHHKRFPILIGLSSPARLVKCSLNQFINLPIISSRKKVRWVNPLGNSIVREIEEHEHHKHYQYLSR